ncbi:MAG: galactokinase [Truepera sp.]|nr:galactokinase [Truepera sp.]
MTPEETVREGFVVRFGTEPKALVRAPGRVNLIGEHTDYNGGFVLPMAIDRSTWIALRPRDDLRVIVHTLDLETSGEFVLEHLERREGWLEYLKGVAWALQEAGLEVGGWEGVISSNVPIAAGLSSSAALELATARAFHAASDFAWNPVEMALVGQRAENRWVGVSTGIMDQLVSATGRAGHAVLIDCRSLELDAVSLPTGTAIVVLDTGTRRGLVDSAYNERREQCKAAAHHLGVDALRDVGPERLATDLKGLDPTILLRARHVVTENARTLAAAEAMRRDDAPALGQLMNESHESLKSDFEVSSDALDAMVACAQTLPGCLGARMTGAGFGGAAVALVKDEKVEEFTRSVERCYRASTRNEPEIYLCRASEGASKASPS